MATSMVSVAQARERARSQYDKSSRDWAAQLFSRVVDGRSLTTDAWLSVPLHPPTEKTVLGNPAAAREWVQSWRNLLLGEQVQWTERAWPSVGNQAVPQKLLLASADELADFAGRTRAWTTVRSRTIELAKRWVDCWRRACATSDATSQERLLRRAVGAYAALDEANWQTLLLVLDWLIDHPEASCYVRELPIRGIDTKWIEQHRKAVAYLHEAFTGQAAANLILKAPAQTRVRFLDESLAPGGLSDISASAEELDGYRGEPRIAIICENLISVMTLPALPGTVALHGGGYGVSDLAKIGWLSHIPVLYWGDLDSHGFAILNQWRHHHEQTQSLMMDAETLRAHRDLCVEEPCPSTATLDRLTEAEHEALALLSAEGGHARLEQERIEWNFALRKLHEAL